MVSITLIVNKKEWTGNKGHVTIGFNDEVETLKAGQGNEYSNVETDEDSIEFSCAGDEDVCIAKCLKFLDDYKEFINDKYDYKDIIANKLFKPKTL